MNQPVYEEYYYIARRPELLRQFDEDAARWRPIMVREYGSDLANDVLRESREKFVALIPQIPYIGGDETWTDSLIESVRCLVFYKAMRQHGKTAAETGKILFGAILTRIGEPQSPIPPAALLSPEQLAERRERRAEKTQERRYAGGYVCEFVVGDGIEFDYGYDFTECASQKFYHTQDADEFLVFFCFLDFAYSKVFGQGLARTMTLAEGHAKCNHRFKCGRSTEPKWPPLCAS